MSPNSTQTSSFYIGLCMAGAVSAGAYTAGVIDYLLEALDEWEKRKTENMPNTPTHKVIIPVIGGASAGGMTGIITAAALNEQQLPVRKPLSDLLAERPENKLYHSWVDLTGADMFPKMLDVDDMKKDGIISLLNSSFIDEIADRAVKLNATEQRPVPPYFDPNFKVFTTLTNLEGFKYNIAFKTGVNSGKYYMAIHNDYACFKLNDDSETEDGWMNLDFKRNINTNVARNAAMATGAFPIGLKSRELKRKASHVNKIIWCEEVTERNPVQGEDCDTLNVDGGVINNEPFEKVRDILCRITGEESEEYQNSNTFKSTVLMIDPFPSEQPEEFDRSQKLLKVAGNTFSAMIEQMRAKPAKLADAMDSSRSGQFLIAPSRRRPNLEGKEEDIAGDKAIACGAFDGFSGFMSKEFRIHDFFLGRHNCEMFLRDYFTIPEEALRSNPIFNKGYQNVDSQLYKGKDGYQIIPIFSEHPSDNYFPLPTFKNGTNWPVITENDIEQFRRPVKNRVKALILNAVRLRGINRLLVMIGAWIVLNRVFANAAMNSIKKALYKHQLIKLSSSTIKNFDKNREKGG